MQKKLTVSFTGNRPQKVKWLAETDSKNYKQLVRYLKIVIKDFYVRGYRHFISGMALGADTIAAQVLLELRKVLKDITLECALPCYKQDEKWDSEDRKTYREILKCADTVTYVSEQYTRDCMHKRNRYLVDSANQVIALWNNEETGGTWYTICYAKRQQKAVILIELSDYFGELSIEEIDNRLFQNFVYKEAGRCQNISKDYLRGEEFNSLDSLIEAIDNNEL